MDIFNDGETLLQEIKAQSWFPYKTGNLKFNATSGLLQDSKTYVFTFDGTVAPYIDYLENGTSPHNIPMAFGRPLPFGTSGRFNGMFHPGSTKHQGFISNKSVYYIINYFITKYKGVLK